MLISCQIEWAREAQMKLPEDTAIARTKLHEYLLRHRDEDDKSGFLALAGYTWITLIASCMTYEHNCCRSMLNSSIGQSTDPNIEYAGH
jgi:hypothetical protein